MRFGLAVPLASAAVVAGHALLYALLKRGVLGRTPAGLMVIPFVIYLLAAVCVAGLGVSLWQRRQSVAHWYGVSALILLGGFVMALIELERFMQVA